MADDEKPAESAKPIETAKPEETITQEGNEDANEVRGVVDGTNETLSDAEAFVNPKSRAGDVVDVDVNGEIGHLSEITLEAQEIATSLDRRNEPVILNETGEVIVDAPDEPVDLAEITRKATQLKDTVKEGQVAMSRVRQPVSEPHSYINESYYRPQEQPVQPTNELRRSPREAWMTYLTPEQIRTQTEEYGKELVGLLHTPKGLEKIQAMKEKIQNILEGRIPRGVLTGNYDADDTQWISDEIKRHEAIKAEKVQRALEQALQSGGVQGVQDADLEKTLRDYARATRFEKDNTVPEVPFEDGEPRKDNETTNAIRASFMIGWETRKAELEEKKSN